MASERFKPSSDDEVRVGEPVLRRTVEAIFRHEGLDQDDAAAATDALVMADLRGVDSHGVSNMFRLYVRQYRIGGLNPAPGWRLERETPATAVIDAERRLGVAFGVRAMQLAVDKAALAGVGVVTVRNAGHYGAIGHYAMKAAEQGMVGFCTVAVPPAVVPTFASRAMFGTNPIALAAPARTEAPLLFDVATSVVAGNQLQLAMRVGVPLPPGWVADHDGVPIDHEFLPSSRKDVQLLPLGSTRDSGSHKGYGFALVAEVLATLLSGGLPGMLPQEAANSTAHFAAYRIDAFTDPATYYATMDGMLGTLRTATPAPGHDRVIYPGLLEAETEAERRAGGIPLHREVVKWFAEVTAEIGIPPLVERPRS